jgi:hypothetical protein
MALAITATSASPGPRSGIATLVDVERPPGVLLLAGLALEHVDLVLADVGGTVSLGSGRFAKSAAVASLDSMASQDLVHGHSSGTGMVG